MTQPKPFFKSLRLKLWLRRWSISAPQMKVRTQLSWPVRAVFFAIVVGLGGAIALWAYDLGRDIAGFRPGATPAQLSVFREQMEKLSAERDQYSTTVNAAESQINIERSAQKQLAAQVKVLVAENNKLKEDLAFFESLLPTNTGAQGIAIRRLKADILDPNQLRYRLLIMQGGKGGRDFAGTLQLVVTIFHDGKSVIMNFPEPDEAVTDQFKLGFKFYQRVEGVLILPDGAKIKAVQARVLEKGQVRAQQSVNL